MTLIGKKAPLFSAPAVINGEDIIPNFSLQSYLGKQAVVLFFYPKDFTFICPTELYALQERIQEFQQRNVAIVGCSTDTEETHWAWLHIERNQGGIRGITYPLVADTSKTIAANYGVLGGNWYVDENDQMQFEGFPVAHRGVFLIDEQGIVRHLLINDLSLGRNIDEILRTIDMMKHVDTHGEVCPVNWQSGERAFKPTTQDLITYLEETIIFEGNGSPCSKGTSCQGRCMCGPACQCNTTATGEPSTAEGECPPKETCSVEQQCIQCNLNKANCHCVNRHSADIRCSQCGCKKGKCHCETTQSL